MVKYFSEINLFAFLICSLLGSKVTSVHTHMPSNNNIQENNNNIHTNVHDIGKHSEIYM